MPCRGNPPAALEKPAPHGRRRCGGKTGPVGWSGAAGGREGESSGQGMARGSIIETVVETQLQAGYTVSPSGACFTSPFFLLAALLDPEKSRLAKNSVRNIKVTGLVIVSETHVRACEALDYEIATGSPENDFRYVGEEADPNSGFYYLRARWMDPGTGRFTSVDPFEGFVGPLSLNKYLYADASPAWKTDPLGLFGLSEALAAISLIGIQASMPRVSAAGVVPPRIEKEFLVPYDDDGGLVGAKLKLKVFLKGKVSKYPEYRWIQYVTTDNVNPGCTHEMPNVPYPDPCKGRSDDKKPFFEDDAKHSFWKNTDPPNYMFFDEPGRYVTGNETFYWHADLFLVGVSPAGGSSYTVLRKSTWGFKYSKGKVTLEEWRLAR